MASYGGYDPTKSFWQNLTGTMGTVGSWVTPNAYATQPDPYQRPINPQGVPTYIPPEQADMFSGAAKGYVAPPQTVTPKVTPKSPPTRQPESPWTSAPQQPSGQPPYSPDTQNQTVDFGGFTWKGNPGQGWTLQGPSGGGQPSGPSEADLSAIYQPGMQSLDVMEQNMRNQLPGALSSIEASYGQGASELDQNLRSQNELLANQAAGVGTAKVNALASARQLYSELQQKYGAMFGSRSSAGPAAQELLGRATTQQFGNLETGAQSSLAAIDAEKRRILDFTNVQKDKFALAKSEAIRQMNNDFTSKLAEINASRGALESAKATARVQALENARAATAQITAAETAFNNQVKLFEMETARQLQTKTTAGTGYDTSYLNATAKIGDILGQYGPKVAEAAAQKAGVPYNFSPDEGYEYVLVNGKWVQKKISTGIFPNSWPVVGQF